MFTLPKALKVAKIAVLIALAVPFLFLSLGTAKKAEASQASPPWHVEYDSPSAFYRISCVGSSYCVAAGSSGYIEITNNSGASFSSEKVFALGSEALGISCVSSFCALVGQSAGVSGVISLSSNSGVSWSSPTLVSGSSFLSGVSCPQAGTCVLVGGSPNGGFIGVFQAGSGVTQESVPAGVTQLNDVSCSSLNYCVAVGYSLSNSVKSGVVLASTNLTSWTQEPIPSSSNLQSVSCSINTTDCFAGGSYGASGIILSATSSSNWQVDPIGSGPVSINGISCSSAINCVAVDSSGFVIYTLTGASGFTIDKNAPPNLSGYFGDFCFSGNSCILLGEQPSGVGVVQLYSYSQSATNYVQINFGGALSLLGIACISALSCIAVGDGATGAVIMVSNDGGSTWQIETAPASVQDLYSVSCFAATLCVGVGDNGQGRASAIYSNNFGATWQVSSVPSQLVSLTGVSCVSSSICFASDITGYVAVSANGGQSWTPQVTSLAQTGGDLLNISCTSSTICFAVGIGPVSSPNGVIYSTQDGGSTWQESFSYSQVSEFVSVSCISVSGSIYCSVGGGGSSGAAIVSTTNSGASWIIDSIPANLRSIEGLSCISSSYCQGVDASGELIETTNGGSGWMSESGPYALEYLSSVSCSYTSQCFAVGMGDILNTYPIISRITPDFGNISGGQSVTIYGAGFLNTQAVSFGSQNASFTVVSDSQINASLPAQATPGIVPVSISNAVSGSSPQSAGANFLYTTGGSYIAVNPTRIVDTRPGATDPPTYAGMTLGAGQTLNVNVISANNDGVPSTATSVIINLTAIYPTQTGYLTVFPTGVLMPLSSSINFRANEDAVANLVEVPLGKNGQISIFNAYGSTNVVADVEGYFVPSTQGSLYNLTGPTRIADTRNYAGNTYQDKGMYLSPGTSINVKISGYSPVPSTTISAVALNITVTHTTANGGYLTVYPAGTTEPQASNVNFDAGSTVPNRVIVKVGANGYITITASVSSCDVIVDLNGYFLNGSGNLFYPLNPTRIVDTRSYPLNTFELAGATLQPAIAETFSASTPTDGVPSSASGVLLNATVTDTTTTGGYLTLYPAGTSVPPTSDLNWFQGETVANMAITMLGNLNISGVSEVSSTDLIIDIGGYFAP